MSSGDDLKSSAQVWGGSTNTQEDEPLEAPPAYEGVISEPSAQQQQPPDLPARPRRKPVPRETYDPIKAIAQWSQIPWHKYIVPDATVSADRITITTIHGAYLKNQQVLIKLLADQAELPPMPVVRMIGTHLASNALPQTDFDITINLSPLLNLSGVARWHNRPSQVTPVQQLPSSSKDQQPSSITTGLNTTYLQSQTHKFLRDRSDRKSFILVRSVDNLPTDVIEGLARNLIASLNYRGKLTVTFPVQNGQFIVQKKPVTTGAAVGGWFMNVLGLSPDIKYETLERVWSIGLSTSGDMDGDGSGPNSASSERTDRAGEVDTLVRDWWSAWAPAIGAAVLLKRQGKIGIEDWMESQMGWRPKVTGQDWGMDYSWNS